MFLSNSAKNLMLDAMDESLATGMKFGSLHTAYSTTGTNEVSGGSPAYARKGLTWAAAASGSKALAATLPTFDVPGSTTVAWLGMWDAVTVGTFLGMVPLGGGALKRFAVNAADFAADTLDAPGHGFSAGQSVVVWGATLPTGLAVGTIYYVIATGLTTDVLELSATLGGSAINITAVGAGFLQLIVPEAFNGQGTYAVNAATLDLGAVA